MTAKAKTVVDWRQVAAEHARRAYEQYLSMEWGLESDPAHPDVIIIYHNLPSRGYEDLRRVGWGLLRRWLVAHDHVELAYAVYPAYPTAVPDAMHASAMVVRVSQDLWEQVDHEVSRLREYLRNLIWADYLASRRFDVSVGGLPRAVAGDRPAV